MGRWCPPNIASLSCRRVGWCVSGPALRKVPARRSGKTQDPASCPMRLRPPRRVQFAEHHPRRAPRELFRGERPLVSVAVIPCKAPNPAAVPAAPRFYQIFCAPKRRASEVTRPEALDLRAAGSRGAAQGASRCMPTSAWGLPAPSASSPLRRDKAPKPGSGSRKTRGGRSRAVRAGTKPLRAGSAGGGGPRPPGGGPV